MHDLRRRALESGKTVSRKARSRQSSAPSSRANSRSNSKANSRVPSRNASDDDEESGNMSDETSFSINSIDELINSDDFNEQTTDVSKLELDARINELLERKGSSGKGREDCLTSYNRLLMGHVFGDVLHGRNSDIIAALIKSLKAEKSEKETLLALRALGLTVISFEDESVYDQVASILKGLITNSQSLPTKAGAIHCVSVCAFFAGADTDDIFSLLSFLLEIVSSDGSFVDAMDDGITVAAACQAYAFLSTTIEDLEADSEDAVEAFADQLDSADPAVQIAAGQAIALLYEKSYYEPGDDDSDVDEDDSEEDDDDYNEDGRKGPKVKKRYDAYHNTEELLQTIESIASISAKRIARKDRRNLHESFATILHTVAKPKFGIRYRNASRLTVRIQQKSEMKIDRWWKLIRLNTIRRLLAGGFINHHFEGNEQILDALPIILRDIDGEKEEREKGNKRNKGLYRDKPRR
ncbi:MAG: hypothetical protein Q9227_005291 [Pyrenula ochraceoflavens]